MLFGRSIMKTAIKKKISHIVQVAITGIFVKIFCSLYNIPICMDVMNVQ